MLCYHIDTWTDDCILPIKRQSTALKDEIGRCLTGQYGTSSCGNERLLEHSALDCGERSKSRYRV